ncbi:MAG: hypothetical protein ABGX47_04665, partial [Martelella sp.]|uniref:hypothetical protein n=1 Tax=Martelella sp. TaxID=1969699 RepID=UPI003241C6EB
RSRLCCRRVISVQAMRSSTFLAEVVESQPADITQRLLNPALKNFFIPIIETTASLALAVLTFWLGFWLKDVLTPNEDGTSKVLTDVLKGNVLNFNTPIPYYIFTLILSFLGRIDGFFNRYFLGQLEEKEREMEDIRNRLRSETQAHEDSKKSYLETIHSALKYLLTAENTGFDNSCRVTIYKLQSDSDDCLQQIFRSSPNHHYESKGRIKVPTSEGVVGAAWGNHGVKEFSCDLDPNSPEFLDKMKEAIGNEGCALPNQELSMPSRHYYARAFSDHDYPRRIGIVVYESTAVGTLKSVEIEKMLNLKSLDVSRLVKHLGVLHEEFNPVSREE